jgi:peptidoglycan/LPS O-acetylase OafA/YrhL
MPYMIISVNRFHIMLIGAIGAIYFYNKNIKFMSIATHKATQMVSWGCLLLLTVNKFHVASVIDGELVAILSIFLIVGQITKSNNIINLENSLFNFVGNISYGVYILHPIIIFLYSRLLNQLEPQYLGNYIIIYSLIISTTLLLAYISYEIFEKRFLNMKVKYSVNKRSLIKDISDL